MFLAIRDEPANLAGPLLAEIGSGLRKRVRLALVAQ
jgi:hypothetical protein